MNSPAGCRVHELCDEITGITFPVLLMYPGNAVERSAQLGPYLMSLAMNAPIGGRGYPLVVISHVSGGSHLVYRTLAAHLARNGFVVAMPEHPGDNKNDNVLAGSAANLANRPRHIRLLIDWAFSSEMFGTCLVRDEVAIVGHSMGGYTALAVAGGLPTAFPHETPDQQFRRIEVNRDDRVKALVLLAPAAAWFMAAGALSAVRSPIFMLTAEKDEHTPAVHAEIIKQGFADEALIEHAIIANAGHFSFLSPFPEGLTNPAFPPSQDPVGFDRVRFHDDMNARILEFLTRQWPEEALRGARSSRRTVHS